MYLVDPIRDFVYRFPSFRPLHEALLMPRVSNFIRTSFVEW